MITKPLKDCRDILPVGLLVRGKDGELTNLRKFELGPLTGRVRMALGAKSVRDNPSARATKMLSLMLNKLGTIERPGEDVVRSLSCLDREFLVWLIELNRAGVDVVSDTIECACGERTDVEIRADELKVNVLEKDDAKVVDGERVFDFVDAKGRVLQIRLVTGKDEERVLPSLQANPEEAGLRSLHAAVHAWDGGRPTWEEFLDLDSGIIDWMTEATNTLDIGATQRVTTRCWSCREELTSVVSPFDFSETASSKRTPVQAPYGRKSSD